MLGKKLKWYPLFDTQEEFDAIFAGRETVVHRAFFGEVLFIKTKTEYFAFENKCPHQGKSLDGCWIENDKVVCPFHQYHYSLENGRGQGLYLEKYELKTEEGKIYLGKEVWSIF